MIELADFGRKKQIEDYHYSDKGGDEDETLVLDSVKDLLLPPGSRSSAEITLIDQTVVNTLISKAQQKRLRYVVVVGVLVLYIMML